MGTHEIPRKEIGAPSLAHLKEVNTSRTDSSGWDIPEEGQSKRKNIQLGIRGNATRWAISDRFDRLLPPHKRYFGRSRRAFLIGILVILGCLLAIVIGLGVGLKKGNKYD